MALLPEEEVDGGISNLGRLTVTNSTFSGNSASGTSGRLGGLGGGIYNFYISNVGGTVTNTIVANSTSGGNCAGPVTDGGHNLDDDTTCGFMGTGCTSTSGTSFCDTNPLFDLAGLQNNGGPTQTIALQPSSPAITAGDESECAAPPVNKLDQRGFTRPGVGATNCSIGAYEFNSGVSCDSGLCVFPQVCTTSAFTIRETCSPVRFWVPLWVSRLRSAGARLGRDGWSKRVSNVSNRISPTRPPIA